jgi:hypothetical protein
MMCDVINAVTEFMVRVLLPSRAIGIRDAAGVEARHLCEPVPCLSGVHFLTCVTVHSVTALMTSQH